MKKYLGIIASLLFLSTTTLLWTGCSESRCCSYKPVSCCETECNTCCEPRSNACCERDSVCECCPTEHKCLKRCKHSCSSELCCLDGITVRARNPRMCMLGDQYPLEFTIEACKDVCDVQVKTTLPEGVTYVRSCPEAEVDGSTLTWNIGSMECGQCIPAKVFVKCECEGDLCACFCATATPVRFCSLLCAKPVLSCQKCGPEEVCLGAPVNYSITVKNTGSCAAEDVVVTDNVPDGLEHSSCLRQLTYKLGCLRPGECKRVNVCLTAVKRGEVCNSAVVTACNADTVSCHQRTNVIEMGIDIDKVGPKEVQLGKNADYQITVTNTGDKSFHNVVIRDCAPQATTIVSANGATVCGNEAVWRLKELKAGEKVTFNLTLTTCNPGCFTNRVHVETCEGCRDCAEFTTRWRGRPALNICMTETEDMICIGDCTSYVITVTNQGSEADQNVKVVVHFPDAIQPRATTGDLPGVVEGQTVTFGPCGDFNPRRTLQLRIDATAKASGDARVVAELSSESIKTPIVIQESTIVN